MMKGIKAEKKVFKISILSLILLAVVSNGWMQQRMNHSREELGLTRMAPLENAPPMLAFSSVALGGFRGLIANVLWTRTTRLQDEGRFFETLSLADWITKLQPTFSPVWIFQSWNMAYNISKQFEDPEERWRWIEGSIQLLRDEAIRINPESSEIYRELAWIFQDKIGGTYDDQHLFYKARWAGEMRRILGDNPDLVAIETSTAPDVIAKRKQLEEQYGLVVSRMNDIQKNLGTFDWRLPETHAIYWAWVGLEHATEGRLNFLRRIIWQSMDLAFKRGRLVENAADQTLEYVPNLDLAPYTHAVFKKMRQQEEDPNYYSTIDRAHMNFLKNAAYYHYLHYRLNDAVLWFRELKRLYPDSVSQTISMEEFALNRFEKNLTKATMNESRVIVNGLIRQFLYYLSIGEEERALGYRNMSEIAWQRYQDRIDHAEDRLGLPPYGDLLKGVLDRILQGEEGFSDHMIAALKTRVEISPVDASP